MTGRPLSELTTVVTSFAFREEYIAELTGMLSTIERCHPDWPIVVGRGTPGDGDVVTFDVESPLGRDRWTLPAPCRFGFGEDDWRRITRMKAWWLHEVWHRFGGLSGSVAHRILWFDVDARCNAPLVFELAPEAEIIAGPWWEHPSDSSYDGITTGLLLLQGREDGPVGRALQRWCEACLEQIRNLAPPTVPWLESDQEVLTKVLSGWDEADGPLEVLKLDHDTFCGIPSADGTPPPEALIDHWMMSAKTRPGRRGPDWPPPEHLRRG